MRRFFKNSVIFIGIFIIIILILNYKYTHTNFFKTMNGIDKFNHTPQNAIIGNSGTSHGGDFDYSDTGVVGFNFSLGSQPFYYDELILRQYIHTFERNAVILIPISYFSFGFDYNSTLCDKINPRYYGFTKEYRSIKNFSYINYLRFKAFPILSASENVFYTFKDKTNMPEKEDKIVFTQEGGLARAKTHLRDNNVTCYRENINILEKIITECETHQLIPVLVTVPYTDYYNDSFPQSFYDQYYQIIHKVVSRNDILYLDYSRDKRITNHLEYFLNYDHLNSLGRKEFTKIVIEELKGRSLLNTLEN